MFSWLYKQSFYVFLPLVSRKKEHIYFNLTGEEDQAKYIVVLHIIYLSLRFFPFLTLIAMVSRKKEHIYFKLTREEDQAKYIVVLHIIFYFNLTREEDQAKYIVVLHIIYLSVFFSLSYFDCNLSRSCKKISFDFDPVISDRPNNLRWKRGCDGTIGIGVGFPLMFYLRYNISSGFGT